MENHGAYRHGGVRPRRAASQSTSTWINHPCVRGEGGGMGVIRPVVRTRLGPLQIELADAPPGSQCQRIGFGTVQAVQGGPDLPFSISYGEPIFRLATAVTVIDKFCLQLKRAETDGPEAGLVSGVHGLVAFLDRLAA
jgi:hypothetical protein